MVTKMIGLLILYCWLENEEYILPGWNRTASWLAFGQTLVSE